MAEQQSNTPGFTRRLVCVDCEWPTEHVGVWYQPRPEAKPVAVWECQQCRHLRTLTDGLTKIEGKA